MKTRFPRALALALCGVLLGACSSMYYAAMEQVGQHKRDILARRVRAAQQDQKEAEEQFLTTYERFKQVSSYDGGDLEDLYGELQAEFDRSEKKANDVHERVESIEQVAHDLFREWAQEIEQIQNRELRRGSQQSLAETKQRYGGLMTAMRRAESRMEPVLVAFRDQVLFLKHNLNARAIASLQRSVVAIEADVDSLIREMQKSIREAEVFLASMDS